MTFTNRAKDLGRVVVSKVVAPFGSETIPSTLAFDFVATIIDGNGDPIANTDIVTSGGTLTTSQAGQIRFTLKNGEFLSFNDLPNGLFTFDLYKATLVDDVYTAQGDILLSAENTADGFTLTDTDTTEILKFTEPGDYHFVVKEHLPKGVDAANPTLNGITYDTTAYGITIRVTESTDRNGRSILSYQTLVNRDEHSNVIFENTYEISVPADVTISGNKTLNGSAEGTDGFTIDLFDATISDNVVTLGSQIDSVSVADGSFSFDAIRYTSLSDVGTHYYVVKESIPTEVDSANMLNGVTYDSREYLVAVTVSDNGDGTLKTAANISLDGDAVTAIEFANKYAITTPTSITLTGEKTLDGKVPKDGEFSFALYKATPSETGLALSGDPIDIKSTTNGVFRFDDITFTKLDDVGFYFYAIKEVIPSAVDKDYTLEGIRYDPTVYYVLVSVQDNGDGTLSVFSENITADGVRDKIVFANKTVQMSDTPATGDSANLALWCFLLLISGTALITIPLYVKRKRA